MKRRLVSILLVAGMAAASLVQAPLALAQDSSVQIDETFIKARKWLNQQHLNVTGSESGRDDLAAFSQDAILFFGEAVGNPEAKTAAQREAGAKRAAVVVAQRALAEYLEGFALVGDTMVKDGILQYDAIRSAVSGFIKGSQVVFQEYNKDKDMAVAIIKIGLRGPKGFASSFYEKMKKDPDFGKSVQTDKPVFKAEPVPLSVAYDGLIIDATEQNFRPALINRIFTTKGDVLYDPAKISQKVLVEQGCGEYTNSVDKAKAALASRGVKNPLVLKASGAPSASDLQVTDEDAVSVFSANQKAGFLAGAKVAFVLK